MKLSKVRIVRGSNPRIIAIDIHAYTLYFSYEVPVALANWRIGKVYTHRGENLSVTSKRHISTILGWLKGMDEVKVKSGIEFHALLEGIDI